LSLSSAIVFYAFTCVLCNKIYLLTYLLYNKERSFLLLFFNTQRSLCVSDYFKQEAKLSLG